jgi:winged helix DNA-binding protein
VSSAALLLTREQIMAHRRRVGELDKRLPPGADSLRRAAWAGLQDSMPRAAVLSIHARVSGTQPTTWDDPSLLQLWGPRFQVYVVAAQDLAVFSLGRFTDSGSSRRQGHDLADRLEAFLGGSKMADREAARGLGDIGNRIRYAAPTGRVVIRWEGARAPMVWTVSAPQVDPFQARLELARRYLHIFGPATPDTFAKWAGIGTRDAKMAYDRLEGELTPVRTPVGDRWILTSDEPIFRSAPISPAPARLLPSGDAYWLLHAADRELMVPNPDHRDELWTPRVWPGALLVDGEIVGTWRRAGKTMDIQTWRALSAAERAAVEAEAHSLPLVGIQGELVVSWA